MVVENVAFAAASPNAPLAPWKYEIRDPLETEVLMEVLFCGICHSDIHTAKAEWGTPTYPLVTGHEFTGIVAKVGSKVTKHKEGDRIGVGCLVNSCRSCDPCKRHLENYCDGAIYTYNSTGPDGKPTYGGYGRFVVVDQDFAVKIPDSLPMDRAAPLLCAGITTYSPIKKCNMDRGGLKIGVVGLGGLGHMAVQFAAAFNNDVYVFSRSESKKELAKSLGAKGVIISTNKSEMDAQASSFDYLIDTVSAGKDLTPYVNSLKADGVMVVVGAPPFAEYPTIPQMSLIMRRRTIMGSCIGGLEETQEMVNFAAEKNILPHIELISCDQVNTAWERVLKSDVKFRFVMDVKNTHA